MNAPDVEVVLPVALLAEGVDRNLSILFYSPCLFRVALLAEGVDRNRSGSRPWPLPFGSPSSRRAWIKITYQTSWKKRNRVALLAEGVDRNAEFEVLPNGEKVALLAEGVDRNFFPIVLMTDY